MAYKGSLIIGHIFTHNTPIQAQVASNTIHSWQLLRGSELMFEIVKQHRTQLFNIKVQEGLLGILVSKQFERLRGNTLEKLNPMGDTRTQL